MNLPRFTALQLWATSPAVLGSKNREQQSAALQVYQFNVSGIKSQVSIADTAYKGTATNTFWVVISHLLNAVSPQRQDLEIFHSREWNDSVDAVC